MKTIKFKLAVAIFASSILWLGSCKKETTATPPPTTQQKILGKWKTQSITLHGFIAGSNLFVDLSTPGDYVDFRNDGTVNSLESGYFATLNYGIISDTKMWMKTPTEIYDIQVLTNSELKLYAKDISALPDYVEYTAIYSK